MKLAARLLVLVVSVTVCGQIIVRYCKHIGGEAGEGATHTHTHTHTRTHAHTSTHEGLIQVMLWSRLASGIRGVLAGSESLPSHKAQEGGGKGRGCAAVRRAAAAGVARVRAGAGSSASGWGWGGGGEQSVGSLTTISHLCLANMAVGTDMREREKMGSPAGTPSESRGLHYCSAGAVSGQPRLSFRGGGRGIREAPHLGCISVSKPGPLESTGSGRQCRRRLPSLGRLSKKNNALIADL